MGHATLKHLIRRLRQLRAIHGLSQEAFAEMAGISYKYYQAVEAGRKRELRLTTLERFARAYRIEVYQLLAPKLPATKLARKPYANTRRSGKKAKPRVRRGR